MWLEALPATASSQKPRRMRQRHTSGETVVSAGRGGAGLKPQHYRTIIETSPPIGFFEVHAENDMGEDGPPD